MPQSLSASMPRDYRGAVPVLPLADYVNNRVVTTSNEKETVPAGYSVVVLTTDADVWMNPGGSAVAEAPLTEVSDGTGSILIKGGATRAFFVSPGMEIGFITGSGTANLSLEYFER